MTGEEAERAGFRPCKRCKPDQPALSERHAAKVAEICRSIAMAEEAPSLRDLASAAGLSPYHFHRVFKAVTGVTPRAYAIAHRAGRVRDLLARTDTTVTEAIYDAGYNSGGRFYATSDQVLGMTPTDYRAGGANTEIHFAVGECSLGSILVAKSRKGVCAILIGDDPDALARDLQDRFRNARLIGGDAGFDELVAKVVGFVEAPKLGLDLPLDVRGTAFQQRVWQALRGNPRRLDRQLRGDRQAHRLAQGGPRRGQCLRRQRHRRRHTLPPGGQERRRAVRLPLGRRAQACLAGQGERGMSV